MYNYTGNIHNKAKHAIDKIKNLDTWYSWRDFKDYVSINQEALAIKMNPSYCQYIQLEEKDLLVFILYSVLNLQ
jgi:hypothetical protein